MRAFWRVIILCIGGYFLCTYVGGHFDHNWTSRAIAKRVECAAHYGADILWSIDCFNALDPSTIGMGCGKIGTDCDLTESYAAGEDQNWDVVGISLGNATHCVFCTGLCLYCHDAKSLSVAGAAKAVCGHDCPAFVAKCDRATAFLGCGFN